MNRKDAFERILDSLNGAMLDDALWPRTAALIDEACGAKGNILVCGKEFSEENTEIYFTKTYFRGIDYSDYNREYYRDYYARDEHLPRMRALPDSKIVHVRDLFSEQELKRSRVYNELLARYDSQDSLAMRLDGPHGSRIIWGVADPIDATGWTSSRIEMIRRVLPHIRQYVRVRSALVDARALGRSVTELLGNVRAGVVMLDRDGRMVEANDAANAMLRGNDGLSDRDGALRAATPADNERLQKLLARAVPRFGERGVSGSMAVRRPSLLPRFALHVTPVAGPDFEDRPQMVAALVLVVDPMERARIDPGLVEEVFGLSPTETEIAVLLAQGRTSRQIATATGRGYSTVRSHLQHIFVKLGVSRQFDVAQLVLALSSLPKSRD